jgi:hypothetical protein
MPPAYNESLTRFDDEGDVRTKTDVTPPDGWSTLYSLVGGENVWGAKGYMSKLLTELGISTEVAEPLFGMQGYMGGSLVLFKAGSRGNTQHYFYSPEDLTVHHITQLNDTQAIAEVMQKSGYATIATEEVEPQQ